MAHVVGRLKNHSKQPLAIVKGACK